jgi:chemotaxis protein histidine kinase CheA/CheY-like chemotaxis protein
MITDPNIREQAYQYFLEEAPRLLETIELELFSLKDLTGDKKERSLKVNNLMRAAHTLKGGAANVGLETIKTISHSFEDILKALYNPDLEIDSEIQVLLFESYDCLRLSLTAELTKASINHTEVLERADRLFARLQERLGEYIDDRDAFPSSEELGIDVVESFFEVVIPEKLQELAIVIESQDGDRITETLRSQSEVFVGLAESLNLPGLGAIAHTMLTAIENNPDLALDIAEAALDNLKEAQKQVLEGDRERGGDPSETLQRLAAANVESIFTETTIDIASEPAEVIAEDASGSSTGLLDSIWGEEITEEEEIEVVTVIQGTTRDFTITEVIQELEITDDVTLPKDSTVRSLDEPQRSPKTKTSIPQTVRVNLDSLERLNDLVGEILINQNQTFLKHEQTDGNVYNLLENLKQSEQVLNQLIESLDERQIPQESSLVAASQKINQAISKISRRDRNNAIDNLKNYLESVFASVSEAIKFTEGIKGFNQQSNFNLHKQQRMLLNMRDELIETRMSPVGKVFNRFPYAIEQLNNSHNKKVNLKIVGAHILIDKAIEDKLYDPLLHLVRNAFDHGIESPEVRRRSGKSEIGQIELKAYYQGSQTIIEVRDDGGGLNLEKIRDKAVKQRLIPADRANKISEAKLLECLFEPGFSTASQVSDLSGRGVGLDVVRSQIQSMKGSINIESTPGEGTIFSLHIPLTLSIAKLMLAQTEGMTYALLVDAIERIIVPTSEQIKIFEGEKVLTWKTENDSQMIPVRRLSDLMEYTRIGGQKDKQTSHLHNPILLLRRNTGLLGLEVDKVIGEQELVIRPLGSAIAPPVYIYGCSVLSNSRLTLVIDAAALIKEAQTRAVYESRSSESTLTVPQSPQLLPAVSVLPKTLLVVDDSSSLRKTIAMSLQKISQQVVQAENGLEALEKLQKVKNVDLIVSDLEMPHMNGLQFLKAVRQNPEFSKIPLVMLTTRDSEKHRRIALDLGAAAYMIKPYDEEQFLNNILELIDKKARH